MTVHELLEAASPALREILTHQELESTTTSVYRNGTTSSTLDGRQPLGPETLLQISTLGEPCRIWVNGEEDAAEVYARVRGDLQDFVAESRFGWGQLRP